MSNHVEFSQMWLMKYYRVMGTAQVCTHCGETHHGSLSTTMYVVCGTASGAEMSHKVDEVLARYAYYLGGKPEDMGKYLPKLETRVEWHKVSVPHCAFCADDWADRWEVGQELPPMMPLALPDVKSISKKNSNVLNTEKKPSTKAKPKKAPISLATLLKEVTI